MSFEGSGGDGAAGRGAGAVNVSVHNGKHKAVHTRGAHVERLSRGRDEHGPCVSRG